MLDCMELEDRVLFSAAPLAMAVTPHGGAAGPGHVHPLGPHVAETNAHAALPRVAGQHALPSPPETNVVLIDSELTDSWQLIAAVAPGSKLFVYNSKTDTAAEVLKRVVAWADATGNRIDDLAILSHGVGGAFKLGNQWITATSLPQTAADWQRLSSVLAVGANIEIFGCNVAAAGSAGQSLLNCAGIRHSRGGLYFDRYHRRRRQLELEAASAGAKPSALAASAVPLNTALLANYGGVLATIAVDNTFGRYGLRRGEQPHVFAHGQQRQ